MNRPCRETSDSAPALSLVSVTRRFEPIGGDAGIEVLKGISLEIGAGESIAIVGPSGSGKTTLLNIMGALDRPTSGCVTLMGKDLSTCSEDELAQIRNRHIGFVFQLHHLLPQCTVLENVLLPAVPAAAEQQPADVEGRARALLERVGLGARLGHRPGRLSGGERQRTAVVRAMINDPGVILADEPTGSLDQERADSLMSLLVDLNKDRGATLVVVTHSRRAAGHMDRVFALQNGKLEPCTGGE